MLESGEAMTETKLCKDCEHYKLKCVDVCDGHEGEYSYTSKIHLCIIQTTHTQSVIDGRKSSVEITTDYGERRKALGECGPSAKFFSPRKRWWRFWG